MEKRNIMKPERKVQSKWKLQILNISKNKYNVLRVSNILSSNPTFKDTPYLYYNGIVNGL